MVMLQNIGGALLHSLCCKYQRSTHFAGKEQRSTHFAGKEQRSTHFTGKGQRSTHFAGKEQRSTHFVGKEQNGLGHALILRKECSGQLVILDRQPHTQHLLLLAHVHLATTSHCLAASELTCCSTVRDNIVAIHKPV